MTACAPARPPMATGETTRRAYGGSSLRPICPVLMRRRQRRIPPQAAVRPASAFPKAPAGFAVDLFADGLSAPRVIRVAPNGDIFVAEEGGAGRVRVFRVDETNAKSVRSEVFAENLPQVFGIAFYPSGDDPHWIFRHGRFGGALSLSWRRSEGVGPGPTRRAALADRRLALDTRSGVLARRLDDVRLGRLREQ